MSEKIFHIVPFMLKHHLTYEQAMFWVECLRERGTLLTIENLECAMLSLSLNSEHNQDAPGVPQEK